MRKSILKSTLYGIIAAAFALIPVSCEQDAGLEEEEEVIVVPAEEDVIE